MNFKSVVRGTGITALTLGVLAGCSGEEVADDSLTEADIEGFYTEDELNTWAEEAGFYTEDDLNAWAEEAGLLDEVVPEEEPVEETIQEEIAIEAGLIEENYLTPLGWTEEELDTYLLEEYDMTLADFENYEDLEATVGPVLTESLLNDLFAQYEVSRADFDAYLKKAGLAEEDFVFVSDVRPVLEEIAADGEAEE